MFELYFCIDFMTLHIDYHLDNFPGSNNLPLLFKVSLHDEKYQVMNINNDILETCFVFS